MEDSDFLGQMMQTDEAASVRFVMECFLLLDPEDLKACRLVSKQWDEFIKREVWNNQSVAGLCRARTEQPAVAEMPTHSFVQPAIRPKP